jgi:hypothetical protein
MFAIKSSVPQESTLGPVLFNICINDICTFFRNSSYLLVADELKMYRSITNVQDCKPLHYGIDTVQIWCLDNGMILNTYKTTIVLFTRKINNINFNYKLCNKLESRSQCVKDLGILLYSKLYFHSHVDWIFSQSLNVLGLIRYIIFSSSALDGLMILYNALVRSKLEYDSVAWNSAALIDSSKLEIIPRKLLALCNSRILIGNCSSIYDDIIVRLNLPTVQSRRRFLDVLFLINIFKNKPIF